MLTRGRGTELYTRAADLATNIDDTMDLAVMFDSGMSGFVVDQERAAQLFASAASGGCVKAMYRLGELLQWGIKGVEPDPARALRLYSRVVDECVDIDAIRNLAWLFRYGAKGIDANPVRAVELYWTTIKTGDVSCNWYLGTLLQSGAAGVEVNYRTAAELFTRAIDEVGHVSLMTSLADLLARALKELMQTLPELPNCTDAPYRKGTGVSRCMILHVSLKTARMV